MATRDHDPIKLKTPAKAGVFLTLLLLTLIFPTVIIIRSLTGTLVKGVLNFEYAYTHRTPENPLDVDHS